MKTQHSPGDWNMVIDRDEITVSSIDRLICQLTGDPDKGTPLDEQDIANAWYSSETRTRGPHSASMGMEVFRSHFNSTRSNPQTSEYCLQRFIRAMEFLESNIDSLDFGKIAVSGHDGFMVHRHVINTLYRFFCAVPDSDIDATPTIQQFGSGLLSFSW